MIAGRGAIPGLFFVIRISGGLGASLAEAGVAC